jgi:hypothetical protein
MTLEQLGAGIDFVSDTTPTNATDGDTFLDTSLSPPQVKVFDASVGSFVRPQTAQNLDQRVSNAGATQSDISSGVDASTTASTVANNLDAPVSNAGSVLNNATPFSARQRVTQGDETFTLASGTGFVTSISASGNVKFVKVDGTKIRNTGSGTLLRFTNNVTTRLDGGFNNDGESATVNIDGIFD